MATFGIFLREIVNKLILNILILIPSEKNTKTSICFVSSGDIFKCALVQHAL